MKLYYASFGVFDGIATNASAALALTVNRKQQQKVLLLFPERLDEILSFTHFFADAKQTCGSHLNIISYRFIISVLSSVICVGLKYRSLPVLCVSTTVISVTVK